MTIEKEPLWMREARAYVGEKEIPGPRHNSKIVEWRRKLGSWMLNDDDPWCGDFVAMVMKKCGFGVPKTFYRAKDWATWGQSLRTDRLSPGTILVFGRDGGGHVGFYHAEDLTHYHVLGGNQSNSVNIMRIAKNRLIAARWPAGQPVILGPRKVRPDGVQVSTNEG